MLTIIDTNNRDPHTTVLKLSNGTEVTVNPMELIQNMLENLGEQEDHSVLDELHDLVREYQI